MATALADEITQEVAAVQRSDRSFCVVIDPTQVPATVPQVRSDADLYSASWPGGRITAVADPRTPEAALEPPILAFEGGLLVYRGRVDNRTELADALGRPELATAGDGHVLAAAYSAWGVDFADRAHGSFVAVVIDSTRSRVVATRDPMGTADLFTHTRGSTLFLSNELETLLAALPSTPSLSRAGAISFFANNGIMGHSRSMFEGVEQVLPGHALVAERGQLRTVRYYQPIDEALVLPREADYEDAVREALMRSMRGTLRANGPVWVDLSGGFDSSTLVALAARLQRAGAGARDGLFIHALRGSRSPAMDEEVYQEAVARMSEVELNHTDGDADPAMLPSSIPAEPTRLVMPGSWLHALTPVARARNIRVRLNGEGGDHVFISDPAPYFLSEKLHALQLGEWFSDVRTLARRGYSNYKRLLFHHSLRSPVERSLIPRSLHPAWLTRSASDEMWQDAWDEFAPFADVYRDPLRQFGYRNVLSRGRLRWVVQDERSPLVERRLVELMIRVPWHLKSTASETRILHRRAMAGILPETLLTRTSKAGVTEPLVRSIRQTLRNAASRKEKFGERLADLGIVDLARFAEEEARWRTGVDTTTAFVLAAVALEEWLRRRVP